MSIYGIPVGAPASKDEVARTDLAPDVQSSLDKADNSLPQGALQDGINTALAQAKESGEFDGEPGKDGSPGVYTGSEPPPEDAKVWVNPNGDASEVVKSVNGEKPDENGNVEIEVGGGTGGTKDYKQLINKPKINGVELDGDKTLEDLGIPTGVREGIDETIFDITFEEEVQYIFQTIDYSKYSEVFVKIVQSENTTAYYGFYDNTAYFASGIKLHNEAQISIFLLGGSNAYALYSTAYIIPRGVTMNIGGSLYGGMVYDSDKAGLKLFKNTKWKVGDKITCWGRTKA